MRCMKISTALLAVPLCLGALACENPTDTEQPEALTNPPAPLFSFNGSPVDLLNGCFDVLPTGVTTGRGGKLVVGTDGPDVIDCSAYNRPGSKGVIVRAGKGDDIIIGSPRDDQLFGGKDCDNIAAGDGNDLVDGGPGDDDCDTGGLLGQGGDDHIKGGKGNDLLDGGTGFDTCDGGKGTDNFVSCDVCGDPDEGGIFACPASP